MQTRRLAVPGLLLASLALAACMTTTSVYYAEGVSVAQRQADFATCEAEARAAYPYLPETRYTPRRLVPPESTCTPEGDCVITPAYWEGGEPFTVDVNEDVRQRAVAGCMGARGYTRIGLPRCEPGAAVTASPIMAPLTGQTCAYRQGGGSTLVVNPAN